MKPLPIATSQEIYQYCLEQKRKKLYPENFPPLLTLSITALLLSYGEQYKDLIFETINETLITDCYDFDRDPNNIIHDTEIDPSQGDTYGLITHQINFNKIPFQVDHTIFLNSEIYADFHATIETIQHEITHLFHKALGQFERQKKEIIYNWGFLEETYIKKRHKYDVNSSCSIMEELVTTESAATQLRNWTLIKESLKEIPQMKQYTTNGAFPYNYQSQFYSPLIDITKELRQNRPLWNEIDQYTLYQPGIKAIQSKINNLLEDETGFQSLQHHLKTYMQTVDDLDQEAIESETKKECQETRDHSYTKVKSLINTMNSNHQKQRRNYE